MVIKTSDFVKSSGRWQECPEPTMPEYAFIGRSNVGKSSLINMITGLKTLAKTSGKPGKTQLINHFIINDKWYLVDLPGYGYAKVAKSQREVFSDMNTKYILGRENLQCLFLLIDSRLEPQKIDETFINWLGAHQVPFALVFTKSDKLSPNNLISSIARYKKHLYEFWEELPPMFICSAVTRIGRDEVLSYINDINIKLANQ